MNWYFQVFRKYAKFSGRSKREEYWYFILFSSIVTCIAIVIDISTGTYNSEVHFGTLTLIYLIVSFIPSFSVTVRRLHDTDRSGLWVLVNFIPGIGTCILLFFLIQDSAYGDNKYGPDSGTNKSSISSGTINKDLTLQQNEKFASLEKLKKLLDDGVLTEEEFKIEKQKLL